MPITNQKYAFTKANVDAAPDKPGVYGLYQGATIYYGSSEISIRSRLQRHQSGAEGSCTKSASTFNVELTTASNAKHREKQLIDEHTRIHGKLPKCNEVSP